MLSLPSAAALSFAPVVPTVHHAARAAPSDVRMETIADLKGLAEGLNPKVGYWDPLNLAAGDFWGAGEEATVGFLRHAEIKHGRVAMAAFVGYVVQANGIYFPGSLTSSGVKFADIAAAGGPEMQWDALPTFSKLNILLAISVLELLGEASYLHEAQGEKHYMMGGKPGFYPSIKNAGIPHIVPLDLYDPFGWSAKAGPEKKARGLQAEINNGRLAMLGIFGFISEAKVPGSVPALGGIISPYAGQPMGFFAEGDTVLPLVKDMLAFDVGPSAFGF